MDQYEATSITLTVNEEFFNEFNTEVKPETLQILYEQTAFECGFEIDNIEKDDSYYYITLISDSKRYYPEYVYIQLSYLIENIRIVNSDAIIYDIKRDRDDWYEYQDARIKMSLDYKSQNVQMSQMPRFTLIPSHSISERLPLYCRDFYLEKKRTPHNIKELRKWLIQNFSVINLNLKTDAYNLEIYSFELITKHIGFKEKDDYEFWSRKSLLGLV